MSLPYFIFIKINKLYYNPLIFDYINKELSLLMSNQN